MDIQTLFSVVSAALAENQQLFLVILAAFLAANILNRTVLNPLIRSIYMLIDAPLKASEHNQSVIAEGKSEDRGLSIKA